MPVTFKVISNSSAEFRLNRYPEEFATNGEGLSNLSTSQRTDIGLTQVNYKGYCNQPGSDDQLLPSTPVNLSVEWKSERVKSSIGTPKPRMETEKVEERTVAEHLRITTTAQIANGRVAAGSNCRSQQLPLEAAERYNPVHYTMTNARRYQNQDDNKRKTSVKNIDNREVIRAMMRMYSQGIRSPRLMQLMCDIGNCIPLRLVFQVSEYTYSVSEKYCGHFKECSSEEQSKYHSDRILKLCNFLSRILHSIGATGVHLLSAAFYIGKYMRFNKSRLNPAPGCSFRLAAVALLISHRYLGCHQRLSSEYYENWSAMLGGVFTGRQLGSMEISMVTGLKLDLYIAYQDFEYFVDRAFLSDSGQNVPSMVDITEILKPAGMYYSGKYEEDCIVPIFNDYSEYIYK